MKLLERIKLGILRNPIKTLLMFLIMFVIVNVLSSSLILFNVTQSVKENIDKKITPYFFIERIATNNNFTTPLLFDYNEKENYQAYINLYNAYQEINQLDEVTYMDLSTSFVMYDDSIHYIHDLIENNRYNETYVHVTDSITGVMNENSYLFKSGAFKIVEGRNFTEEEIRYGNRVMILPKNESILINGRYKMPKVGDRVSLSYLITKNRIDEILNQGNLYYEHAEIFLNNIVTYEEYEFEIIGLYDEINDYGLVFWDSKIVPYNALNQIYNNYINNLDELIKRNELNNIDQYGKDINSKFRSNRYSCFEINSNIDLDKFKEKVELIMNKYGFDNYKFDYGNEEYLKIVGPLESLNTVSKTILIIGIVMSIVIIGLVSIMVVKDRRHEIGILLILGESKTKIMIQLMLEMLCIGLLAVSLSLFTSKGLTRVIENNVLSNYDYYKGMDDYESTLILGVTKEDVLNQYNTELESNDMMTIALVSSCVLVITSGMSVLFVFKMNPKEILM